ncbi:glycerophosphoryl diester phosphodiesterase [Paenibacillus sp. 1_12]|uniref:glycerophosphodiester phosphodiesterase n=1 Tax=Paenibacillus sp. 1_12 TaxID=1566278 RepID=UPI0008F34ACF|nr:glycerophosphodiester phosphodiesterase family protein [Paenibacillus sp. 1_12]SFM30635.1 glycerophosphoryl diester phosphodiesterase [Paenibacillus sp. 1_12]
MRSMPTPMIIGHRGSAGEAPENTLASFRLAVEQGAHAIELDAQLTKDGEIVVIHDKTIDRTTNGRGAVAELTLAELKCYDAGSWFHEKYKGEQIPTLAEVYEQMPDECVINVEIKGEMDGTLERKLAEFLYHSGRKQRTLISSFLHKSLMKLKVIAPESLIGLGYTADVVDHIAFAEAFGAQVYSLHPHYKLIGLDEIRLAVDRGLRVYPYTVNDENDMRELLQAGASGLITDFPGRMHKVIGEGFIGSTVK